jgi:hypothetical protein
MSRSFRFGSNNESKRIKRKPINVSFAESERHKPLSSTESFGLINYDPVVGWYERNLLGADADGLNDEHFSTNHLRRSDGLPGTRL